MKEQSEYEQELKNICKKMKRSFTIKSGMISAIATKRCLKKIIRLNTKTRNENINELVYVLGRTKMEYKKYCSENNYYTDPYVNKKIKEAYIKLSRKAMKLQTKKSYINRKNEMAEIEYNSDRGSYIYKDIQNNKIIKTKEYTINNIKHLGSKRAGAIKRLKQFNFGINIFDELGIDDRKFYKVNPDIIHILLNEGKINQAKMYIKEVVGGEKVNKPLKIKYVLNRDIKKGVFSPEENKNMKKMARADRISNELIIFSEKKAKEIVKPKESLLKKVVIRILNIPEPVPEFYFEKPVNAADSDIRRRLRATNYYNKPLSNASYKNTNTGRIVAYGNMVNDKPQRGRFVNTNTAKIAAYGTR